MRLTDVPGRMLLAGGLAMIPVAATAQEAAEPQRSAAQQLIHDAANGRPIRRPESMTISGPASNWHRPAFVPTPLASEEARADARDAAIAGAGSSEADSIEARAAALRPGQFLWMPERATSGEVVLVVSLAEQRTYVYRGGALIGVSTASTGMASHPTPTGSFTILQKRREHYSNLYDDAPMPNMQRLTWDGIAFHAGALPGYPDSHGCIRLPMRFSQHLFAATRMGGRVHIIGESPPSATAALSYVTDLAALSGTR